MKKTLAFLLALLLTMSLLTSAALAEGLFVEEGDAAETPVELPPLPTELIIGNTTKLSGNFFTELWGNNTSDVDVRNMLFGYQTIVWTTQTDYDIDPTVVQEVRTNDFASGDREYVIILQEGLTYSDGSEITAADYVFTVLLTASKELKALGAAESAYNYLTGYSAYHSGESDVFTGVRMLSDNMFSLRVRGEFLPYFYENAYINVTPYPIRQIAPGCAVADDGAGAYITNDNTITIAEGEIVEAEEAAEIEQEPRFTSELLEQTLFADEGYASFPNVVSGPYTLVDCDIEAGYVKFKLNPYYIGNHEGLKPVIEDVTLKCDSAQELLNMLIDGEIHLVNKCVSQDVINQGMATEFQAQTYPRRGYGFISFACETGPQASQKVRQAIYYALDQNAFVENYFANFGMTLYGYYGIGQWMVQASTGAVELTGLTPEEQEEWDSVTLEELNTYDYNLETAAQLLIEDGWTLNADGGAYESGVRYKLIDGELIPLSLKWAKSQGSNAANALEALLAPALEEIGVELLITEMPFEDMLRKYYRLEEREYDMFFLATNFSDVFEPSSTFSTLDEMQGTANTTGYRDPQLEALTIEMRQTTPGDMLGYYTRWFEFQKYYNQVLPTLPLYSDVYVDFYVETLLDYNPAVYSGWPAALMSAFFGYEEEDPLLMDEEDIFLG